MPNSFFKFKQFTIHQDQCAMKVSTEACIMGAWVNASNPNRVLDIGTGTGLLALMLAQRYDCPIDAVELDGKAAKQATENAKNSPWSDRIQVFNEDIKAYAKFSEHKYDLIICNPPFFQASLKSEDGAKNAAKHETEFFNKEMLADVLKKMLSPGGVAFVIYPEEESRKFHRVAQEVGLFATDALTIRNQPNAQVFRIISKVSKIEIKNLTEELTIREGAGYSKHMTAILDSYYL